MGIAIAVLALGLGWNDLFAAGDGVGASAVESVNFTVNIRSTAEASKSWNPRSSSRLYYRQLGRVCSNTNELVRGLRCCPGSES